MPGTPPSPRRATLKAVAERAGVSVSTASLVFSGKGPVSPETRDRVRAAADDLGYVGPDPLASSLRRGRSGVVAVIVEGRLLHAFHDPYAVSMLDGLAGVLDEIPAGMLLISQGVSDPERAVERLSGTALDACVFLGGGAETNPLVPHLAARGIPMVGLGSPTDEGVVQVRVDDRAAMRELAGHVSALGHERVAHVALPLGPARTTTARTTVAGLLPTPYPDLRHRLEAVVDVFGPGTPAVESVSTDVEGGAAAARLLLGGDRSQRPTAVLAQSDLLAMGVVHAAEGLGLRVPEDLTVTGFDGIPVDWWSGSLTTVVQPGAEKGAVAGRLVRACLDGEHPASETLATRLRVGTSSAPPVA